MDNTDYSQIKKDRKKLTSTLTDLENTTDAFVKELYIQMVLQILEIELE